MSKAKIFISWSGGLSHDCAKIINEWISTCLYTTEPFVSSQDINAGAVWFNKISKELEWPIAGIVCLTNGNKNNPWILFESGSLAKGLSRDRVCTVLIDLGETDVDDPLAQFNHTDISNKESMKKLLQTINAALEDDHQASLKAIEAQFEQSWESLSSKIQEAKKQHKNDGTDQAPDRTVKDLSEEILIRIRDIERYVRSQHASMSPSQLNRRRGLVLAPYKDTFVTNNGFAFDPTMLNHIASLMQHEDLGGLTDWSIQNNIPSLELLDAIEFINKTWPSL